MPGIATAVYVCISICVVYTLKDNTTQHNTTKRLQPIIVWHIPVSRESDVEHKTHTLS